MLKKGLTIFVTFLAIVVGISWYKVYLPLSPEIQGLRSKLLPFALNLVDLISRTGHELGIAQRIKIYRASLAFLDWIDLRQGQLEKDIYIEESIIADVPVTIIRPAISLEETPPVLIHFHGGGFTYGEKFKSYKKLSILYAKGTRSVVIAVNYRLAPENIFPAQFNDGFAVVSAVLNEPTRFGIDGNRVALGGDSAGGLLSAAISLEIAKQRNSSKIAAQVLIYPWLQLIDVVCLPSYKAYGKGFVLSKETIGFFASAVSMGSMDMIQAYVVGNVSNYFMQTPYWKYLKTADNINCKIPTEKPTIELPPSFVERVTDQRLSPLLAENIAGSPPTFIGIAEYDVLASEGMLFTERLRVAKVPVVEKRYKSYHAFLQNAVILPIANDTIAKVAITDMIDFLNSVFYKNV